MAVQFIKNAQRTQHEKASIPVNPFLLNDSSASLPTSFDFTYVYNDIKYNYGFSATKNVVVEEHLYHWPKGQRALVFTRDYQNFHFVTNNLKIRRELIAEAVAPNQLYFAIACTMNEQICINAMTWFRDCIYFSRDYADFPGQLLEYSNNPQMLKSISEYAKVADVGIEDMRFEIYDKELSVENVPDNLPDGIKIALIQFIKSLSDVSTDAEQNYDWAKFVLLHFIKELTRTALKRFTLFSFLMNRMEHVAYVITPDIEKLWPVVEFCWLTN